MSVAAIQAEVVEHTSVGRRSMIRPLVFFAAFAVYLAVGYVYAVRLGFVSTEGLVRTGVVGDLLLGNDLGRQGLVSSMVYPPLPTLLIAAFGVFPAFLKDCFAAVIISALFGGVAVALFDLTCAELEMHSLVRALLVLAFLAMPALVASAASGTSGTMLASCALALLYLGLRWERTRELKYFLGFAVLAGLSPMVSWQGTPLAVLALAAISLVIAFRVSDSEEQRGLLWALAFPTLYMIATWIGLNWVIMEDPLFAFRVLWRTQTWWQAPLAFAGSHAGLLVIIVLASMLLILTLWLARMPLQTRCRKAARLAAAVVMLATIAVVGFLPRLSTLGTEAAPHSLVSLYAPPATVSSRAEVAALESRLDEIVPKGKLIADGFYGYPLWYYGIGKGRLIRTLDFSSQTTLGVREPFFVIVPTPEGVASAEDVHVKFPGIHQGRAPFIGYYFFYVGDVGTWQIYKLMQ